MSAPAPTYRNIASQLLDVQDKLTTVRSLHEAIFMSAFAICTSAQRNAIQTVVNLAEEKLQEIAEEVAGLRSQDEDEDQDELVAAILRYHAATAKFNAIPNDVLESDGLERENAFVAATYGAPLEALKNRTAPADTMAGAVEALRFGLEEAEADGGTPDTVKAMIYAALAYLEGARA